jgi:hypothetical protein
MSEELGYENFSKPDVHVKDIFWALGLSPWGTSDYEVFKAVARVARNVGVTPTTSTSCSGLWAAATSTTTRT